jgi:hypothetical protein
MGPFSHVSEAAVGGTAVAVPVPAQAEQGNTCLVQIGMDASQRTRELMPLISIVTKRQKNDGVNFPGCAPKVCVCAVRPFSRLSSRYNATVHALSTEPQCPDHPDLPEETHL